MARAYEMLALAILLCVFLPGARSAMLRAGQPQAGDLVHEVKKQLFQDHRELGNVSATLLSVESNVDHTESSMLGKVLDLQTARHFFDRHQEIGSANAKLKLDVSKLNAQVEGLSSTMSKVQKVYLKDAQTHHESERKLRSEVLKDESEIQNMNAEFAKEHDVKTELHKLTEIHENLLAEEADLLKVGMKTEATLQGARSASKHEVARHKSLRDQLVGMNRFSMSCHANVATTSKKLGRALLTESRDNHASAMTLRQQKRATDASEQRLLAERALLVSEVEKVEVEEVQELARVKDLRHDMQTLEHRIVTEVRAMETKIDSAKERVKSLTVALMENAQAETDDVSTKAATDAKLSDLREQVHVDENPIAIATTEAQNDALKMELVDAFVLWKSAKTAETAALLNLDQAAAQAKAQKHTLMLAIKAVAAAREEGQARFAEAVETAAASKEKSKVLRQKAQSAIAGRCKTQWDAIWKKKRAKFAKCKVMQEEFAILEAKKDTLTQVLKAQASD